DPNHEGQVSKGSDLGGRRLTCWSVAWTRTTSIATPCHHPRPTVTITSDGLGKLAVPSVVSTLVSGGTHLTPPPPPTPHQPGPTRAERPRCCRCQEIG